MKRVVITSLLLSFCVGVSLYTIYRVHEIHLSLQHYVNQALDALEDADEPRLETQIVQLSEYWHGEEGRLLHFVRHAQIDDITKSVARLQALASGKDYSELAAELASILWQMEHIDHSEQIILQNIL